MQSLMGKERAFRAFDRKRDTARLFRLACAPLPFTAAAAVILSGRGIFDAIPCAVMGWALSMKSQTLEMDAELETLAQCVGRPRLAKALASRLPNGAYQPTYKQLGKLDRLNSTQMRLLHDFFVSAWRMTEEDRDAAISLLHR